MIKSSVNLGSQSMSFRYTFWALRPEFSNAQIGTETVIPTDGLQITSVFSKVSLPRQTRVLFTRVSFFEIVLFNKIAFDNGSSESEISCSNEGS